MASTVRVEESLRVKIGEAKKLPSIGSNNNNRGTYCACSLDQEQIFRTSVVEKTANPFYGEELQCSIPKKFRFLKFYVYEKNVKQDKAIGSVCLRREELHKLYGKDHWFPLRSVDENSEVMGKVHIEIRFNEFLSSEYRTFTQQRMAVRVLECSDLTIINGACNPYAAVTLTYGKSKLKEIKRTIVKRKTICPQFDETFFFDFEKQGQNHDRNMYTVEDMTDAELSISLWHDDTRVSREVLGGMFPGSFLGEVKISLKDVDTTSKHNAWYFLQGRNVFYNKSQKADLGSLRLKITYSADHVFDSHYYNDLRNLLLNSIFVSPITSSAVYILGETADYKQDAAMPLIKLFLHHGKLVPFIEALAEWEISKTTDPNTIFRGNTLTSKCTDELMKLVGIHYLHDTLKDIIDEIFNDNKPCEIDPSRLKDGENIETNMLNLTQYVEKIFQAIVNSGLLCPTPMCEVFFAMKKAAMKHFPENKEVRYLVVSGFVFLRFFAPAILGPKLFQLRSNVTDADTHRTLTLVSKTIQSLGNLVGTRKPCFGFKEEYMMPVFKTFTSSVHMDSLRMFLDIISSTVRIHPHKIEAPIVLKEGMLTKRAQGRRKFGVKNFKKRYFCLTNQSITYAREKGQDPLCEIPLENILAVEPVQEESFRMKYMFQIVQPERVLYVQASNCVEEREWLDLMTKICNTNNNKLKLYHPAAFINGHFLCCKQHEEHAEGCTPVTGGVPADIKLDIDSDHEVEKIHSLFLSNMEKLEKYQDACACREVYMGDCIPEFTQFTIEDTKTCFETLNDILACVISLEQEHKQYTKMLNRQTIIGSEDAPYGDDSLQWNTRM